MTSGDMEVRMNPYERGGDSADHHEAQRRHLILQQRQQLQLQLLRQQQQHHQLRLKQQQPMALPPSPPSSAYSVARGPAAFPGHPRPHILQPQYSHSPRERRQESWEYTAASPQEWQQRRHQSLYGEGDPQQARAMMEEQLLRREKVELHLRKQREEEEEHQRLLKRFHGENNIKHQDNNICKEGEPKQKRKRSSFPTSVAPGMKPPERRRDCDVCGDESSRHHLNYGANVCFSCRAFFRRAHQHRQTQAPTAAAPQFVCKWSGACVVTTKNRRRCQKCRYDKCVSAGMRPECVLDMAQRRHRFRKAISKREAGGVIMGGEESENMSAAALAVTPPPSSGSPTPSTSTTSGESHDEEAVRAKSACSGQSDYHHEDAEDMSALPPMKRLKMRYWREMPRADDDGSSDDNSQDGQESTSVENEEELRHKKKIQMTRQNSKTSMQRRPTSRRRRTVSTAAPFPPGPRLLRALRAATTGFWCP